MYPLAPAKDGVDSGPFYGPGGRLLGRTLRRHGAHLHGVANGTFGLVFASHVLEHFMDPIATLLEWDRVLAPGGILLLVLPFAPKTYDRLRAPTSAQVQTRHPKRVGASL